MIRNIVFSLGFLCLNCSLGFCMNDSSIDKWMPKTLMQKINFSSDSFYLTNDWTMINKHPIPYTTPPIFNENLIKEQFKVFHQQEKLSIYSFTTREFLKNRFKKRQDKLFFDQEEMRAVRENRFQIAL